MRLAGLTRLLLGTLLLAAALPAQAELSFDVKLGWEGRVRNGRWNPIVVELQNPTPIQVDIELYTPRDSSQAIMTRLRANVASVPQSYVLYVPLVMGPDAVTIKITDLATGKTVGERKLVDPDKVNVYGNGEYGGDITVHQQGLFLGTTGAEPVLKELGGYRSNSMATVGYLKPAQLPWTAMGYDALDVLVLNQPDLNTLAPEQKKALLDWVRAGGRLLIWFGAGPLAQDDPIVRALPCTIGENTTFNIDQRELTIAGLTDRFSKLGGRILVPIAGAAVGNVLGGGGAKAVYGRYGFGDITVLSFDGSALLFRDNSNARSFWEPLLLHSDSNDGTRFLYDSDERNGNDGLATTQVMDLLGNVPGVGAFGFGYVAITLIALMLIVGPVDWFVLKWLGRQPWTWVTTTGWIGLVTVGAVYLGHLVRSGDLHLRTLRIVDQADGAAVARTDFVGIYSPRTADYDLDPVPGSWWEPLSGNQRYYGSEAVVSVLNCRQTQRDNLPDPKNPMTIPVWNLRFLRGETIEKGSPVIEAALHILPPRGLMSPDPRMVGTIKNLSDTAISQIRIQARGVDIYVGGDPANPVSTPARILPHGVLSIDLPLRYDLGNPEPVVNFERRSVARIKAEPASFPESQILRLAETLTPQRARRVTSILPQRYAQPRQGFEELACIYALLEDAPAAATLKGWQPIEKHWTVVRALVKLQKAAE